MVYVVSYYDDIYVGNITVSVFDNYDAAFKMYEHELKSGKHDTVCIDEAPVYSRYIID